jgi:hypothetical protein
MVKYRYKNGDMLIYITPKTTHPANGRDEIRIGIFFITPVFLLAYKSIPQV